MSLDEDWVDVLDFNFVLLLLRCWLNATHTYEYVEINGETAESSIQFRVTLESGILKLIIN